MPYTSITVEGGLFPADLLDRIATGDAPRQRETDFRITGRLSDEMQSAFSDMRSFWDAFQRRLAHAPDRHTTVTRESWIVPLLERLGYRDHGNDIVLWRPAPQIDGVTYAISHRAGEDPDALPVHIVSVDQSLDRRSDGARRSPHAMVQEFLNRSPALWGIVTNGRSLRLLRDTQLVSRPTYLEIDLQAMVEGNLYSEFVLLYRLLHRTRLPANGENPNECPLETYFQEGIDEGGRVREHLREGVEAALEGLGSALLAHPRSETLRQALQSGELDAAGYYRELLRLVYRLLFLMVVEERRLLYGYPSSSQPQTPPTEGRGYGYCGERGDEDGAAVEFPNDVASSSVSARWDPANSEGAAPARVAENLIVRRQLIYKEHYSLARLRDRAERPFGDDRYSDLWEGLLQTFRVFREEEAAWQLGLSALNGELFGPNACRHLETASCENRDLLRAIFRLSTFMDGKIRRRVNYAGLDVEELGSVYESLLDYRPSLDFDWISAVGHPSPHEIRSPAPPWAGSGLGVRGPFQLVAGSERKQTGSYYTPPSLVRELIESALVPVIEDRLHQAVVVAQGSVPAMGREPHPGASTTTTPLAPDDPLRAAKEAALLDLRVCDPAAGSGHFLLAAARRIARELAKVRTGEKEPAPEAYRKALRDVVRSCLYAVDKNELAVDLCKVALWIEGYNAGYPLSFLDNHIKHGDALVSVWDLDVLTEGIPDEAYAPVTGDDRKAAASLKKRNKEERKQLGLDLSETLAPDTAALAAEFGRLGLREERTPYDVHEKERAYQTLRAAGGDWWRDKAACDLWTAAFFLPLREGESYRQAVPTTQTIRDVLRHSGMHAQLVGAAVDLAEKHPFFHWPIEFPDVWERGGFDVVLGNPPWERIKLQEEEFFAGRDPEIAQAPNKAARERLIRALPERNPALAEELEAAKHRAEAESKFVRGSGRFPLCGRGDVNTYSIFAELNRGAINGRGHAGCIVPSGIASDDTTKLFFQSLMDDQALASLYDLENREAIFPGVHRSYKFCLLTLTGTDWRAERGSEFAFFLLNTGELRDADRRFVLTREDMRLLNPNTRTCPIFRSRRDAELTKAIYRHAEALCQQDGPDDWQATFLNKMIDFTIHADLIEFSESAPGPDWWPVYEAKMISHFNHRLATYGGVPSMDRTAGNARTVTQAELADPFFTVSPRCWVTTQTFHSRMRGKCWDHEWFLGWRDITNSTNERTAIFAVRPGGPAANTLPLLFPVGSTGEISCLVASLSAFAFDFAARQKVGGTHLNTYIVEQLPVLPRHLYARPCKWSQAQSYGDWIEMRALPLVYTAWDMRPFALDLGYDGPPFPWDEERRFLLRCELDAAFFHLYGIAREDVDYIMETFPIVKRKDETKHGEYRTKRVILELYDAMARAMEGGTPYGGRIAGPDRQLASEALPDCRTAS